MAAWLIEGMVHAMAAGPLWRTESQTPYGRWSIADQVERLACFDLALGPPARATAKTGHVDPRLSPTRTGPSN